MLEDLHVAGFCLLVCAAGAAGAYVLSKRTHEGAVARVAELSLRIESAHQQSAELLQAIRLSQAGLERKITRNAMQSITKQARDLTSAVIGRS
jgi:hypothetical protein